jgi:hypothetical protein
VKFIFLKLRITQVLTDTEVVLTVLLQCDHIVRIESKQVLQLLMSPDFDVLSASLQLTFNLLQSKLIHPVIRLSEMGEDIISSEFLQALFIKLQSMSIKVLVSVNIEGMCK